MTFDEVKKDYLELLDKYGYPEDMTGGFVDAEHMEKVIRNPTKANAKKYMIDVIQYGFQDRENYKSEFEGHINIKSCDFLNKIYSKYF